MWLLPNEVKRFHVQVHHIFTIFSSENWVLFLRNVADCFSNFYSNEIDSFPDHLYWNHVRREFLHALYTNCSDKLPQTCEYCWRKHDRMFLRFEPQAYKWVSLWSNKIIQRKYNWTADWINTIEKKENKTIESWEYIGGTHGLTALCKV